ncbi:hypothetical protein [Sulfolobus acidocaldarius]|uniref:hypothetical protein n=1 Tax=Sulfolobus acidocaldarius TaxID=2285 RepID=UPI001E3ADFB4|nr:hypothetical protein [Sulfolobus acidocaldarius]
MDKLKKVFLILVLVLASSFVLTTLSDYVLFYTSTNTILYRNSPIVILGLSVSQFAYSQISQGKVSLYFYITNSTQAYFLNVLKILVNSNGYFYISNVTIASQNMVYKVNMILKNSTKTLTYTIYPLSQSPLKVYQNQVYNVSFVVYFTGSYQISSFSLTMYYSYGTDSLVRGVPP